MQEQDICPAALKAARKQAKGNRGLTQEELANLIKCSKDTVSRWERGETRRVRAHLRDPLCKALGVEWDALTTPPDPETPETRAMRLFGYTRMQRWVRRHVPPALLLVAKRYGVTPSDVLDIAPLLFLIVAERSLLERRRRLDEMHAIRTDADRKLREITHLVRWVSATYSEVDELLEQEKNSLSKRDIFGDLIELSFLDDLDDDFEGPFVHYVRSLTDGLPQDAVTSIESYIGNRIGTYQVADDTLRELTGIATDEQEEQILDHIRAGRIDLVKCVNTRKQQDEANYRQWLQDALAEAEETSRRELSKWDELLGTSALNTVSDAVATAPQERESR